MTEDWFGGAIKRPGPAWKAGYTVFGRTSQKTGVVDHSAEGPLEATLGVLDSWRTASWHFTNDGLALYQHYPITDVCWHAGFEANKKCVGVENTGRKDEPLTESQYLHLLALHRWLKSVGVLTVCERRVDLWEHNEWMATDCPSGRIPWDRLIADLKEKDMTDGEVKQTIKELLGFGPDTPDKEVIRDMKKVRFQGLIVTEAVGLALVGKDWKRVREIMDFFNLGR